MDETTFKMSKKEFWIRFGIWFALAVVAPFAYIFHEYGLFRDSSPRRLSGWGIIAIIFVAIMMMAILRQARQGMPKGSMVRQCIDGYSLLVPIIVVILIIEVTKDKIEGFERFLIFMVACEAIAVPINPMPKWGAINNVEFLSGIFEKFWRKGK